MSVTVRSTGSASDCYSPKYFAFHDMHVPTFYKICVPNPIKPLGNVHRGFKQLENKDNCEKFRKTLYRRS